MKNGFKVIDCDRHVVEPADIWDRYLDKRFAHYQVRQTPHSLNTTVHGLPPQATVPVRLTGTGTSTLVSRKREFNLPHTGFDLEPVWRGKFKGAIARGFNTESYLFDMDKEGVDIAVCFTGMGLYATWRDDLPPDLADGMCRAYNNWLYDYMAPNPGRLKGVCLLPFQDLELAKKELRRAATELGMVGIFWRPNPHMGRLMSDPALDEIYSLCEELNVTVCVHEGIQNRMPWFGMRRVENGFSHHMTCHPYEQMGAFVTMAAGGVFDRHPKLRAAYLESGAGWLPYWAERLDALHRNPLFAGTYRGSLAPSEYFKRGNAFVSTEADEKTSVMLARICGDGCLMWASDYPHTDAMLNFPHSLDELTEPEGGNPPELITKVLWDNPARFFALDV